MKYKAWIFQINISNHGLPKLARPQGTVTLLGFEGDRQENQKVHGGTERALCLYSLEKILALQEEGHEVFPGALGENLTITGLDWELVKPGTRMCLGEQVIVEVTQFTRPCYTIANVFREKHFERINHDKFPGWSRVYTRVIHGGHLQIGDSVQLA